MTVKSVMSRAVMQGLEASVIDHSIKLILIDSIAALVRSEFSHDRTVDRQQLLGR